MSQETKTETKTTYASEHEARIAVTNALLLPNIIRVWWSYEHWNKEPGAKPYTVTVETILKQPDYSASDFIRGSLTGNEVDRGYSQPDDIPIATDHGRTY